MSGRMGSHCLGGQTRSVAGPDCLMHYFIPLRHGDREQKEIACCRQSSTRHVECVGESVLVEISELSQTAIVGSKYQVASAFRWIKGKLKVWQLTRPASQAFSRPSSCLQVFARSAGTLLGFVWASASWGVSRYRLWRQGLCSAAAAFMKASGIRL